MGIETKKVCLGKRINVYEGKRARLGRGSGSLWYKPERVSIEVHCMRVKNRRLVMMMKFLRVSKLGL